MTFEEIIDQVSPDIYQELKQVVATGKWLDGRKLSSEQSKLSLQTIIAYEARHVEEIDHTGVIKIEKNNACNSKQAEHDESTSSTFARFKGK